MDPNNFELVDFDNQNKETLVDSTEQRQGVNFEVVDEIKDFNE